MKLDKRLRELENENRRLRSELENYRQKESGTMLDLTERKLAEEKLKKSENLLQKVLEVLPVGVFVADEQGKIAMTNPACEKIWGGAKHVPIERFIEYKGWWRDTGKRIAAEEWAFARAFLNGEISLDEEIDIECFDGTRKTIQNSAMPVKDDSGGIISAVAVIMDITCRIEAEKSLRENEERFRTMADNISPFAWMADNKGLIFWYNKRWFDYTGTTLEEMQGWGWKKVHHPDHVDRVVEKFQHYLETGEKWEDTFPLRGKDGNYRWFLSRAVPIMNEKGEIVRWFGTNTDITELKETQELLNSERELLQAIFDSIPVMIGVFPPDLSYFKMNRAFEELTGRTGKEDNILELVFSDPGYRNKVKDYDLSEAVFRDVVMTTRDGREIETIWANVKLNDDTRIGIGVDISERKAMEEKLRNQALMLDQVQDAIVAVDHRGEIRYMNDAALKMYELDKEQAKRRLSIKDHPVIRFDHRAEEEEMFRKLEETGTWHGENAYFTSGGKRLWIDTIVSYIKDPGGKILGTIYALRDITERKKFQEKFERSITRQKKTSELFENLLFIAAHDLKGPIANMFLALNLIDRIEDPAGKIETINFFRPLVDRLENTIKGLTSILQVENIDESDSHIVYFETLVNEILLEHRGSLYKGAISHDFRAKPSISYIGPFLASIMKNLVTNAIKYSRDDTPLKIEITTREISHNTTLLTVKDNGIGIDLEKHGKDLFVPFRRIDTGKTDGTGIGLYIVKSIIEKNGGYIHLESTPGEGTTFHCYLKAYGSSYGGT